LALTAAFFFGFAMLAALALESLPSLSLSDDGSDRFDCLEEIDDARLERFVVIGDAIGAGPAL
jgi:hypothetical protein